MVTGRAPRGDRLHRSSAVPRWNASAFPGRQGTETVVWAAAGRPGATTPSTLTTTINTHQSRPARRFVKDCAMRFVHFTDTHVMAGGTWQPRRASFEFDTEASLRRVVAAIAALDPAPAFAVLGGDLASPDLLRQAP